MLRFFFKALITIWPFLQNVIFKDQTFQEAYRANRQFTFLFVLLMFVVITLFITSLALSETKGELQGIQQEVLRLTQETTRLEADNKSLAEDIEKNADKRRCTVPQGMIDKSKLIKLLE